MKHFSISFKPDGRQISIHAGATLLEAAGQAGIILNTICGGQGTCEKCLVRLEPDGKKVLACQYHIQSDLTVTIPPESRFFEHKILTEGIETKAAIEPDIYKNYRKPDSQAPVFGLAVDVGTTTVVAKLIDMTDGRCIATQAALNPQTRHGDDVISRISFAQTGQKLTELHKVIIGCIKQLAGRLCTESGVEAEQIYEICIVGNTTMNHIFLKLPISQLGRAPYAAYSLDAHNIPAGELGLQMNPASNIHTVENIAGFVGADTTAVALAVDINSADRMTLVVDIGTNGELVLGTKDKLYAASCAAGPAFEGARINCGSRAAEGAIETVVINKDDIDLDVIGNSPARSICGSGLLDAVALLLELGVIDTTGRFAGPEKLKAKVPPAIFARIIEYDSQPAFLLADTAEQGGQKVVLTQKDIRETQLAKAAIRTGITLLLKKAGISDSDIERVYLAGAFGNYIRKESALRIGLLPEVPPERIHFVGNAAAAGAQMALISSKCRAQTRELARNIEYIEIAHEPDFQDVFADCMLF